MLEPGGEDVLFKRCEEAVGGYYDDEWAGWEEG
jgi:hypothetical protein